MSKTPETKDETERRLLLEENTAALGREIGARMPDGIGFAFFMFDFGAGGNLAYVSNAKRDDMADVLHEWLGKQGRGAQ